MNQGNGPNAPAGGPQTSTGNQNTQGQLNYSTTTIFSGTYFTISQIVK